MNCPTCTRPLVAIEMGGLEIDYCIDCSGIWLDSGELEMIAGSSSAPLFTASGSASSKRYCPICTKYMMELAVGDKSKVKIDSCRLGHGLWFDRGELQLVIPLLGSQIRESVAEELDSLLGSSKLL